jgi:hypothetical protein
MKTEALFARSTAQLIAGNFISVVNCVAVLAPMAIRICKIVWAAHLKFDGFFEFLVGRRPLVNYS